MKKFLAMLLALALILGLAACGTAEEPAAAPAVPKRRFSLPRLSRRGWLLLGGGCAAALVVAVAVLAGADRPAEGFQAGPAPLVRIESLDETGSEYFYYNGELLAGPKAGLIGFPKFLNDESCLAMDTDGDLTAVVTADGVVELDLPEGSMTGYAASADGSRLSALSIENGSKRRRATSPQNSGNIHRGARRTTRRRMRSASTSQPAEIPRFRTVRNSSVMASPPFGSGRSSPAPRRSPPPRASGAS